jgi:NAD-dependent deacetylase
MHDLYCTACDYRTTVDDYQGLSLPPPCPECRGMLRPDVILFGEMLHEETVERLYEECQRGFDAVFSVGTTSVFSYIAEPVLSAARRGVPTIEINPGVSEVSDVVQIRLPLGAAAALDAVWSRYCRQT